MFKKAVVISFILICLILFGCNAEKNKELRIEIYATMCENGCLKMTVLNLEAGLNHDEQLLVECQDYCGDLAEEIIGE